MQPFSIPLELSRVFAAIEELGAAATDIHKFHGKRVAVSSSQAALATPNGRYIFITSIRLLSRFCTSVTVYLPSAEADFQSLRENLEDLEGVNLVNLAEFQAQKYDAQLCVEDGVACVANVTYVNSSRWLAKVASTPLYMPQQSGDFNPVAAYGASCLAVANVFKALIKIKASRALNFDDLSFSFYNFVQGECDGGKQLVSVYDCRLLLVGAGAIGSAVAYVLRDMPLYGLLDIVDYQKYAAENLATTIYLTPGHFGKSKARVAADYATNNLAAIGHEMNLELWLANNKGHIPVVLNALDNIPTRRQVQQFVWPDVLIDGATGSFLAQVIFHQWSSGDPCLLCLFEDRKVENADQIATQATGLSIQRVTNQHSLVTQEDVNEAPTHHRDWLKSFIGKEICSVIQQGVARSISSELQNDSFAPAAPFVAGLSACMMLSALYRHLVSDPHTIVNRFQFDSLTGPAAAVSYKEVPKPDCLCQTRRTNIEFLRWQRRSGML